MPAISLPIDGKAHMKIARTLFFLTLTAATAFAQIDPGAAIGQARQAIAEKNYDAAIEVLESAMPAAAQLLQPQQRTQATAALHFYSAIAYQGKNDVPKAKEHLVEFFTLMPDASTLDASKYDRKFVKTFNEVRQSAREEGASRFELLYPGYNPTVAGMPKQTTLDRWNESPDFVLLSTAEEKKEWTALTDDNGRQSFVDRFWERRDVDTNASANEARIEFLRRVAFADEKFSTDRTRGALTDRGRVFVLFGVPQSISVKPYSGSEGADVRRSQPIAAGGLLNPNSNASTAAANAAATAPSSGADSISSKGLVERWTYKREQLPASVPQTSVAFKFITEEGYGDHVLQRESVVLKAMLDAARPSR
jgi:GWxTD domain-containing protein